jgi:flagellar basal-body rod protein FlgB
MADQDLIFGIHAAALRFQTQRMAVLASNIANADTPGFQAKDLDFSKVLAQAAASATAPAMNAAHSSATNPGFIPLNGDVGNAAAAEPETLYRVPLQPSADGNTVDLNREQAAYADAALHYQASLGFINNRLSSLMTAITGT